MKKEIIFSQRSSMLRKNDKKELLISMNCDNSIYEDISNRDLMIKPENFYMVINMDNNSIEIQYNKDISQHQIIYNPYKYINSKKSNLTPELFVERYDIPKNYIDTLPKWYSFKFTYPDYNLIFVRPEFGLSIQVHKYRNEFW
ncbi:MAG: hypothetical protein ACXAB8_14240, partial [Promethearchaeota archaeon]